MKNKNLAPKCDCSKVWKILLSKSCFSLVDPLIDPTTDMVFTKIAGAKCDDQRIGVHACVRANLDLDVQGACVRLKKRSQLTPWLGVVAVGVFIVRMMIQN